MKQALRLRRFGWGLGAWAGACAVLVAVGCGGDEEQSRCSPPEDFGWTDPSTCPPASFKGVHDKLNLYLNGCEQSISSIEGPDIDYITDQDGQQHIGSCCYRFVVQSQSGFCAG